MVADDLIWASRLVEAVRRAGADPVRLGARDDLLGVLARMGRPGARPLGAIVDLFGRGADRTGVVRALADAGVPVIAVAEHDDLDARRRALAAGAERVYSYNKLFTDGARLLESWLAARAGEAGA